MKSNKAIFGIQDMYKTYQRKFGKDYEAQVEKEVSRLEASSNYLYTRLASFNIKGRIILTNWNTFIENVEYQANHFNLEKEIKEKIYKITNTLIAVNKLYRRKLNSLVEIKKNKVTEVIFKDIIYTFNQILIKDELLKGEIFRVPNLGLIAVVRKTRSEKKKVINWNASNKYKQQLIEEGKLPREYTRDNKGNIISDNGGVDWLITFSEPYSYWLFWNRFKKLGFQNASLYSLVPARTGFKIPMNEVIRNNKMSHLIFKEPRDIQICNK